MKLAPMPPPGRNPFTTALMAVCLGGMILANGLQWLGVLSSYGPAAIWGKVILMVVTSLPLFLVVAWKALSASPADADDPSARQVSITDILVLTSVLALEIAAVWQKNVLLTCLFLSVSISILALSWKRLLLRRALLVTMAGVMVLAIIVEAMLHRTK